MKDLIFCAFFIWFSMLANFGGAESFSTDGPEIHIAQSMSTGDLERLLKELKASGRVPSNATICSVDWIRFGVQVNIQCYRSSSGSNADTKVYSHKDGHEKVSGELLPCNDVRVNPISCQTTRALIFCGPLNDTSPACNEARSDSFLSSISLISSLEAVDICKLVLIAIELHSLLDADNISTGCSPGGSESILNTQNAADVGREEIYIRINRRPGSPPHFTGFAIFQSKLSSKSYDRIDFLIYWAFDSAGVSYVNVEPVFAMSGTMRALSRYVTFGDNTFDVDFNRETAIAPISFTLTIFSELQQLFSQS